MIIQSITLPAILAVGRPAYGRFRVSSYSPLSLFSSGEQGAWYDPSDLSTLFQDSAGTTPVTAMDQPVGLMLDKSGRGNHARQSTAASRPAIRFSGGIWYLEFDGVNDFMVTTSIDFTATSKVSVFSGVAKISDLLPGTICELGTDVTSVNGSFALTGPDGTSATYGGIFRGSATQKVLASGYPAGSTHVLTSMCALASSQILRVSGVQVDGGALQGSANFGNYPLYIGMRAGLLIPFRGYLAGLIVRGEITGGPSIAATEKYIGVKSGISL